MNESERFFGPAASFRTGAWWKHPDCRQATCRCDCMALPDHRGRFTHGRHPSGLGVGLEMPSETAGWAEGWPDCARNVWSRRSPVRKGCPSARCCRWGSLLSGRLAGIIAKPQPISSVRWKAQALRRQQFSDGTAGTERINLAACVTRWRDWECLVELNSQADFDQSPAIDVNVAARESTRTL